MFSLKQFTVFFLLLPTVAVGQIDGVDVEQILRQHERAFVERPGFSMAVTTIHNHRPEASEGFKSVYRTEGTYIRDSLAGRIDIKYVTYDLREDAEKLLKTSGALWDGERYVFSNAFEPHAFSRTHEDELLVRAYTSGDIAKRSGVLSQIDSTSMLDGDGLIGDHYASVFLRRGGVRTARSVEGPRGTQSIHMRAVTSQGAAELWLSLEPPHRMERLEIFKGTRNMDPDSMERYLTSSRRTVDVLEYAIVDGIEVPTKGTLSVDNKSEKSFPIRFDMERTAVEWHPDFDSLHAFEIDLPAGTSVRALDLSGVKYIWNGVELAPEVPDDMIEAIDDAIFQVQEADGESSSSPVADNETDFSVPADAEGKPRGLLYAVLTIGIFVVCFSLALLMRRRLGRRAG